MWTRFFATLGSGTLLYQMREYRWLDSMATGSSGVPPGPAGRIE